MSKQLSVYNFKIRGDTIIEVLLATSIMTALIVSSYYLMNRGIGTSQRSLEITQVRAQIDNQADMLRHISNLYYVTGGHTRGVGGYNTDPPIPAKDGWRWILKNTVSKVPDFDFINKRQICEPNSDTISKDNSGTVSDFNKAFFINDEGVVERFAGNAVVPSTFARIVRFHDPAKPTSPEGNPGNIPTGIGGPKISFNSNIDSVGYNNGYVSNMLWVYAVKDISSAGRDNIAGDMIDFHIRACWYDPDGSGVQTMGTIVRMYIGDW